jgi:alkanesulfonate monooxygenase SsuD/methylene tetrahydromethanopterin reductase-like flavin-dependent oxidoreductase (luciferase family)
LPAAATERLQLLTYLTVPPWRNPLLLAKTAATLDRLSRGRLILGVGTGYLKAEYAALGVEFEERNRLFDEALEVMPLAWSGDAFSYSGQTLTRIRSSTLTFNSSVWVLHEQAPTLYI